MKIELCTLTNDKLIMLALLEIIAGNEATETTKEKIIIELTKRIKE